MTALVMGVVGGCGNSGSGTGSGTGSVSVSVSVSVSDAVSVSVSDAVPAAVVDAAAAAVDDRCADPCRFLADTTLADVDAAFAAACGGAAWPAPAACDDHDHLRNCIYAVRGYTFTKARWRDVFAAKPWYRARADFREADLGKVGADNVSALRQRAKECRAGNAITAADRARVEAFFETVAAGKPKLPKVTIDNLMLVPPSSMAPLFASRYRLEPSTPMRYAEVFPEVAAALPGKKQLRLISVDLSGCQHVPEDQCDSALWVDLVFDETDTLVAVRHGMMG